MKVLTLRDVRKMLAKACAEAGGDKAYGGMTAFCAAHGLSTSYVHGVLHGPSKPGPRVLKALDIERVYVKRSKSNGGKK